MTTKEAHVYIVDVGRSMGVAHNGRTQSDLDWAMSWVWDKITGGVATERKTLLQAVVALKSDTTRNDLQDDNSYANIEVLSDLQQILLPHLKKLGEDIKPSSTDNGDAISAIVVALTMIGEKCKHLKYEKAITLVTNGMGRFDTDQLDQIAQKLRSDGIRVTILGVDFDDPEYGFKEEDKPFAKQHNEVVLRDFAEQCGGGFGTLAEAVEWLGTPRPKETRPVPSYKGTLALGDPINYPETVMTIEVERYPRTMIRRPQAASSFVIRKHTNMPSDNTNGTDTVMGGTNDGFQAANGDNGLEMVRNNIAYTLAEKDVNGNHKEVPRDDLARGYEYGRTAVHISESDEGVTKLDTAAGLEIIGFVEWDKFERYMAMSTTNVIVAQRSSSKSIMALSSFIHALHEMESFAVVRLVPKEGKEPIVELLAPSIDPDFECLIDVHLPFAEDVRLYKFPPLDKVVTVSGKVLKEHRHLPNDKLQEAMDIYVDSMDLSSVGTDSDGNPTEYADMREAYSPVLHRIDQAVRWRAVHPNDPIPPPYEILTRFSQPPKELQERTQKQLEWLQQAADVKKVPPKVAGRKKRETVKPLSGLDVDALLGSSSERNKVFIDPKNPIPSFRQTLNNPPVNAEMTDTLNQAAQQLGRIIEDQIKKSFGDSQLDVALEELRTMKEELLDMEDPGIWNEFVKILKQKLVEGDLGGKDKGGAMWWRIRKVGLGLYAGKIPGGGQVSDQEAKTFLASGGATTMAIR